MSLENQIANLVGAANNLTSEVAGKMRQIDNKVDAATLAVPNTIRKYSEQRFYIDAIDGDDSNDGSPGAPLKTIAAVRGRTINGSRVMIYPRAGQTHYVKGFGVSMNTGMIRFSGGWGKDENGGQGPSIVWSPEYDVERNAYRGFLASIETGSIMYMHMNIIGEFDTSLGNLDSVASLFGYANSYYAGIIYECSISLKNVPVFSVYSGYSGRSIHISKTSFDVLQNENGHAKLIKNNNSSLQAVTLDVYAVELKNGLTWDAFLEYYADKRNILTNLDLAI